MEACVKGINNALESGTADEVMTYLLKPEALLPRVDPSRPYLYFDNLKKARVDKGQVFWTFLSTYVFISFQSCRAVSPLCFVFLPLILFVS